MAGPSPKSGFQSSSTVAVTFDCVFKHFIALSLIPQIHGFNLLNLHQYSGNTHAINRANRGWVISFHGQPTLYIWMIYLVCVTGGWHYDFYWYLKLVH